MFTRKSKAQKLADEAKGRGKQAKGAAEARLSRVDRWLHEQGDHAGARAAEVRDKSKEVAGEAAHTSRERLGSLAAGAAAGATVARDRAVHGIDHGIDVAAPKVSEAVGAVGPKVDHARDVIVDDLLPKLQHMVGSLTDRKDEVLARTDGPVAVVTGAPKKKAPKGRVLLVIGLLAAAGAGIAAYLQQQQKSERSKDPWAEPSGTTVDLGSDGGRYTTPGETTSGVAPVGGEFPVRTTADVPASGTARAEAGTPRHNAPSDSSTDAPADGTAEADDDITQVGPSVSAEQLRDGEQPRTL